MQLIANAEFWIAALLLVASQISRSSALRNLVSDVHVFRLRDIIALNSAASLLNVVGPARMGDILRIFFLARKGLGIKFAFSVVLLERLFDLTVVLLFAITLKESLEIGIFYFVCSLLILTSFVVLIVKFRLPSRFDFLELNQIRHFVSRNDLRKYFGKLGQSWVLALGAAAILNIKKEGFLLVWLNWNAKLGEPFAPLISRNQFLLGILLLPLLALLATTVLFRNSAQVALDSLKKVAENEDFAIEIFKPIYSEFSGSGCDIFTASGPVKFGEHSQRSLICKVEPKSRLNFLQAQAEFMRANQELFDFPKVHTVAKTANYNLIVMDNIQDFSTGLQSKNYASIIRDAPATDIKPLLHEVVNFLIDNKYRSANRVVAPSIDALLSRIDRVSAFCAIQGTYGSRSGIDGKGFEATLTEISRLLKQKFEADIDAPSHGDATLSNFIRQETHLGFRIRSIDPNPRVRIGRIEYDLGKIFQSVSSMYEETIHNPEFIELGIAGFISRKSNNSSEGLLLDLIQSNEKEIDLELLHLFHLTHLVRILPYQYRSGPRFVKYWQDVIIHQFECKFK